MVEILDNSIAYINELFDLEEYTKELSEKDKILLSLELKEIIHNGDGDKSE